MKKPVDPFALLTWADLEEWAGSRIVGRGKQYQRTGCVSELARTADGSLIAWVHGSERYATIVQIGNDGEIICDCTCPYELNCKHAVAVVLEYLDRLKKGHAVPQAHRNDKRLKLIEMEEGDDFASVFSEDGPDEDMSGNETTKQAVAGFLKGKTKAELIQIIHGMADHSPGLYDDILDRQRLERGHAQPIIKRLRYLIREVCSEPGWQNYWRGEGYTPDYSEIRNKLQELLDAGYADEVLTLGAELMQAGQRQVESSDDEGETGEEISSCMPVIVDALEKCSMPVVKKLTWATDAVLRDEFSLFEPLVKYLHGPHGKAEWSALADILLKRLSSFEGTGTEEFSRKYERDKLSDWAIHALERAGRKTEIIPLCEKEAPLTSSYPRLVKSLVSEGRLPDAERWIRKGINATESRLPGIALDLRRRLLEIRRQQGDKRAMAALLADEFVRMPGEDAFSECKRVAEKLKTWPAVRSGLIGYLETGRFPWKRSDWPLPTTGTETTERGALTRFPDIEQLIGIAIYEHNPDQVIRWYDRLPKQGFFYRGSIEGRIAEAVKDTHPDRAIAIWKALAERRIQETKPKAYREAAVYLRQLGKFLSGKGCAGEWTRYLAGLRTQHARKSSLIEVLDSLEDKPIVKM